MHRVTTARADAQTARAYWTMSRGDSERAFRAARRHSRMVRLLRVALPLALALAALTITLMTYFNPLRMIGGLPANVGDLVISGSKITMEQPRLAGFTHDGRAYELTADAAQQDLTKPDFIELHNIHAKIQMQDKSTVRMTALKGLYNSKTEILNLNSQINLSSNKGYHGKLSEAVVDIAKGHVVSEHPVELEMLQGTLDANRMEIIDSGDLIRFTGGVRMTMMLNKSDVVAPTAPSAKRPIEAEASARRRGAH